jgi:hypothetical protein
VVHMEFPDVVIYTGKLTCDHLTGQKCDIRCHCSNVTKDASIPIVSHPLSDYVIVQHTTDYPNLSNNDMSSLNSCIASVGVTGSSIASIC